MTIIKGEERVFGKCDRDLEKNSATERKSLWRDHKDLDVYDGLPFFCLV